MIEWLRFIDNAGYIDFDKFLQLPPRLYDYIIAIRVAESLKNTKQQLKDTKDSAHKKKLSDNIRELEAFFNGGK